MGKAMRVRAVVLGGFMSALVGCTLNEQDLDSTESGASEALSCALALQTSGAVEARLSEVEGCSTGSEKRSGGGTAPEIEQRMGAMAKESDPISEVQVVIAEALYAAGADIEVVLRLETPDGRLWETPKGACTADYSSEACDTEDVENGRQYTLTSVRCTEGAQSAAGETIVIDALSITSRCETPSDFGPLT